MDNIVELQLRPHTGEQEPHSRGAEIISIDDRLPLLGECYSENSGRGKILVPHGLSKEKRRYIVALFQFRAGNAIPIAELHAIRERLAGELLVLGTSHSVFVFIETPIPESPEGSKVGDLLREGVSEKLGIRLPFKVVDGGQLEYLMEGIRQPSKVGY